MDVRALVFGDGDIVSGCGSLKVDSDGEWLDCIHYVPLVSALRSSRSPYSVRLLGGDIGSLLGDRNDVGATVTGVWRDDAIEVRSVAVGRGPLPVTASTSTPPCPPPLGGWRRGRVDENLEFEFELRELLANGAAVSNGSRASRHAGLSAHFAVAAAVNRPRTRTRHWRREPLAGDRA